MPTAVKARQKKRQPIGTNDSSAKKQKLAPTVGSDAVEEHLFSIGRQISYRTITASLSQSEKNTRVEEWFELITNEVLKNSNNHYIAVGLDCEW